jgi:hypothetical protein
MRLGAVPGGRLVFLEPIEDLVGPEAFEPAQRLVEHVKLVGVDAANLLDCVHMLFLVSRGGHASHGTSRPRDRIRGGVATANIPSVGHDTIALGFPPAFRPRAAAELAQAGSRLH